jgi:lipopolysaccharide/colanic/teichoic acid biosynthesis glycosyltransferase
MTTSIIPTIQNYYTVKQQPQDNPPQYCTIQWRRNQLLVMPPGHIKQPHMPSLHKKQLLVDCLKGTPANLVRIDPRLGEARLKFWADACFAAGKPIFLRIPSTQKQLKTSNSFFGWLKRMNDWLIALIFLLAFSPLLLGLVVLMRLQFQNPIFSRQWYIGERGRLFKVIRFRTTTTQQKGYEDDTRRNEEEVTVLGRWMLKYGLDHLPQLLNVLKGDMSLLGPKCWSLEEGVRLNSTRLGELNALPGLTSLSSLEEKFKAVEPNCRETV